MSQFHGEVEGIVARTEYFAVGWYDYGRIFQVCLFGKFFTLWTRR